MKRFFLAIVMTLSAIFAGKAQDFAADTVVTAIDSTFTETEDSLVVFELGEADLQRLELIRPEMKYRELKNIYKSRDYRNFTFVDRREHALGKGIASLGVAGIGQFLLSEKGIGVAWLVPDAICIATAAAGACVFMSGCMEGMLIGMVRIGDLFLAGLGALGGGQGISRPDYTEEMARADMMIRVGSWMFCTGLCCSAVLKISSMIHAIHIAKIKNMYYDDLKKMSYAPQVSVKFAPYMDVLSMNVGGFIPVAGISLKLTF